MFLEMIRDLIYLPYYPYVSTESRSLKLRDIANDTVGLVM